jgi:hypothetical protein
MCCALTPHTRTPDDAKLHYHRDSVRDYRLRLWIIEIEKLARQFPPSFNRGIPVGVPLLSDDVFAQGLCLRRREGTQAFLA